MATNKRKSQAIKTQNRALSHSIINQINGMGTCTDQGSYSKWTKPDKIQFDNILSMYNHTWQAKKGVNLPSADMFKEWREFEDEKAKSADRDFNLKGLYIEAVKKARLHGVSYVMPKVEEIKHPYSPSLLKRDQVVSFEIIGSNEVVEFFDEHLTFNRNNEQQLAHSSWIATFYADGQYGENESVIKTAYRDIINNVASSQTMHTMMGRKVYDFVAVKDLDNSIEMGDKELGKTLLSLSNNHATAIDAEDTATRLSVQLDDLPKIHEAFKEDVAGAFGIPITRFLGSSSSGLNATGQGDKENYYDSLVSWREQSAGQGIAKIDSIVSDIMQIDMTYEWLPLYEPTLKEKAEINKIKAETKAILANMLGSLVDISADTEKVNEIVSNFIDEQNG